MNTQRKRSYFGSLVVWCNLFPRDHTCEELCSNLTPVRPKAGRFGPAVGKVLFRVGLEQFPNRWKGHIKGNHSLQVTLSGESRHMSFLLSDHTSSGVYSIVKHTLDSSPNLILVTFLFLSKSGHNVSFPAFCMLMGKSRGGVSSNVLAIAS